MRATDVIPDSLRARGQWLLWTYEKRGGDRTKVPYQPSGARASSTEPDTWSDFETVIEALERGRFSGVGFAFSDQDLLVGIDLDDCVDSDGDLTDEARRIVDGVDSYAEWSPSGEGVHIIARGMKPGGRCKAKDVAGMKELEIYDQARYFTVTGDHIEGTPRRVEERPQAIREVYEWAFGDDSQEASSSASEATASPTLDDEEILEEARAAENSAKFERLWEGDLSEHDGDHSRADLALVSLLAFYTQDPDQLDRLFRRSGLCREKWTSRPDYRKRTINKALEDLSETYEPPQGIPSPNGQVVDSEPTKEATAGSDTYRIQDRTLLRKKGDDWRAIAEFRAQIATEITKEDGTRLYGIEGMTQHGRPFDLEVDAEDFERPRKLRSYLGAAAGATCSVRVGQARHLPPAIKAVSSDVDERRRYERTGWSPDGFLMPGMEPAGIDIALPQDLPYEAPSDANLEAARNGLDALIRAHGPKRMTPLVAYALTGPLVEHISLLKRYGFFIYGRTGSLKTSVAQVLLALWGSRWIDDRFLLKLGEGMTRNAAMALATRAADVPILFDNYKPQTGSGEGGFINLIHNVIEGGEKARLNRNARLKDRRSVTTWPVVTGEDIPNTDPASLARMLAVEFSWPTGKANEALTQAQHAAGDLPAIGRTWIEFLSSEAGAEAIADASDNFEARRRTWAAYLRDRRPDMVNILRVASNLASNSLAYEAATKCEAFGDILSEYFEPYQEGLKTIAHEMGGHTSESLEAQRLLSALKEMMAAGDARFKQRLSRDDQSYASGPVVGFKDTDGYYLLLDKAKSVVNDMLGRSAEQIQATNKTLYSQLDDMDLIARKGSGRTTRNVRAQGKQVRALHLTRDALKEPNPSDG